MAIFKMGPDSGLIILLQLVFAGVHQVCSQRRGEQTRIQYRRVDEIQPGAVIGSLPQDGHLDEKFSSDVLYNLRYELIKGNHKSYFKVDSVKGTLSVTSLLDRDVICSQQLECDINLDVAIVRPVEYFEIVKVTLTLEDDNDNNPAFPETEKTLEISENAAPPVSFVLPSAVDPDCGLNGIQSYEMISEYPAFALQTMVDGSGISDIRLELRERLNREEQDSYEAYVVARDGGDPPRSGMLTIHIIVVDANDNSPTFEFSLYNVSVKEDHPTGIPFLQVKATDPDEGLYGQVTYGIASQVPSDDEDDLFTIDSDTGEVSLAQHLDYETKTTHHLLVSAQDRGPDSVPVQAKLIVHVQDVNDFIPEITVNSWTATGQIEVLENAEPGKFVAHVSVDDQDLGVSGQVTCHVTDTRFQLVSMYTNTFKLITTVRLDREQEELTTVTVDCADRGLPSLSSSLDVTVHVLDANDHTPVFSSDLYQASVAESVPLGYSIMQVAALDEDSGDNARVTYHLHANSNSLMSVNATNGIISTNSILDYETRKHLEFTVLAIDSGQPPRTASATISIEVLDVNDESPTFNQNSYNFGVYENQLEGTEVGHVSAKDKDSPPYDRFRYILQKNKGFEIDAYSGIISTKRVLDREHEAAYYLLATAKNTDSPYLTGTVTVTIYVTDKNDNAPTIIFPKATNETAEVSAFTPKGYIVTKIKATDADQGDNAKLVFTIARGNDDDMFAINKSSGVITVKEKLSRAKEDTHSLLILVQDCGDESRSATVPITILINRTRAFVADPEFSSASTIKPSNSGDPEHGNMRSQHLILIILGAITVVLVSILVTAIVCIKKRQRYRDRDSYKYMCRIDLPNQLSALQDQQRDNNGSRRESAGSLDEQETEPEKGEFLSFQPRDSGIPAPSISGSFSDVSNGSQVALQISLANGGQPVDKVCLSKDGVSNNAGPGKQDVPTTHAHNTLDAGDLIRAPIIKNQQPEAGTRLSPGERDSDSTSGCSAEYSNSDSGKGNSDASDQRHVNHLSGVSTTPRPSCPTHGKNVTFGEVTCHSPTRSREYLACPLPQCAASHFAHRNPPHSAPSSLRRAQDNKTGCHGNVHISNKYSPNTVNGSINSKTPLVMSTFGYDQSARRQPHRETPSSTEELRGLMADAHVTHVEV